MIEDCLPQIWEEFLFILRKELEWEDVYGWLYSSRGKDKKGPGVFSHREGLVEGPCEGVEVGSVGRGGCCLVGDSEEDSSRGFHRRRETKREEAFGLAKKASSEVGEGCCHGGVVWVRGWGLPGGEESSLGTGKGSRPLLNAGAAALPTC